MKKAILIILMCAVCIAAKAQFTPTVPYVAYNPTDSTLYVFNPTTGTWRQLEKIQVVASNITTNPAKIQIWQNTSASGSLTQNMPGLELFPLAQNNSTNIYTPAIKFGSADPDLGFPTGKAKFLAGIIGRATQVYSGTTSGGMSMDMLVSKNTPGGTTTVPTIGMNIGYGATVVTGTVGLQTTVGATTDSVALISGQVIKRIKTLGLAQNDTTRSTGLSSKYEVQSYKTATQSSSANMYPNWLGVTNYVQTATQDIINTATDANYTITSANQFVKLPVVTANRTVSIPTAASYTGRQIRILNQNTSGTFSWSFTGATIKDAAGNTLTTLVNTSVYVLESDGTNYYKLN